MDNPWASSDPWQPERPDDDWAASWSTGSSTEATPQPADQWGPPRPAPAPPDWLDSLLRHCHQVSQEVWPAPESGNEGDWRSGLDNLADIVALVAQLAPADPTLPPAVQFSASATAKAMNEALKLTRHLPVSSSSPLSRLLASKGSLEWEKYMTTRQEAVPETVRVGWRVLEKEDRLSMVDESKPKKASGGFLSFWSRRASAIQAAPVDTSGERSNSPAKSSLEGVKSLPYLSSSQSASPPKASITSTPPPPSADACSTGAAAVAGPSAVSRFLNRFSRTKGTQHGALALSSDDLEFLSDIVPSASDLPDEDTNDSTLNILTSATTSSPLPPKLPPPILPPPKQSTLPDYHSSAHVPGTSHDPSVIATTPSAFQAQGQNHSLNIPVLPPPLSPKPTHSSYTQSSSSPKDVTTPTIAFGHLSTSIQQSLQSSSQLNSRRPSSTLLPLQKVPPLLPPPPISPPQTPRPNVFTPQITFVHSSTLQVSGTSTRDPDESDDEFTAFKSFPAPASAPFSSPASYPLRSPSPPSPPPRRTYERKHYPSSSSVSSILSPASQSSVDKLYSTTSPISTSLDSFDDFTSLSSIPQRGDRKHTPSPPPLPAKSPSQHWQLPRIDTYASRAQHSHTPSQTFSSPTAHTSLITSAFSVSSVSNAEHQRTQALVNHAAARGGLLWPNSPVLDEPKAKSILPPPPSTSPPPIIRESFDLLGGDTFGDGLGASSSPVSELGGIGMESLGALGAPSDVAGGRGNSLGLRNQLQPSPPPLPSISAPILSSSILGTSHSSMAANASSRPPRSKQTGGLSAQDLSFFEGL